MLYQCLCMLMDAEYGTGVDENGIGSWGALLLGLAFIVARLGYFIYRIRTGGVCGLLYLAFE